jgi:hypothetical protein
MMSSVAADNMYHYGDISGRIAQLQQQSLQGQAVIDANSQQQVCKLKLQFMYQLMRVLIV